MRLWWASALGRWLEEVGELGQLHRLAHAWEPRCDYYNRQLEQRRVEQQRVRDDESFRLTRLATAG